MTKIKPGDRVKWTSQSGGYVREKVGILKGIVPGDNKKHLLVKICGPLINHRYMFQFHHTAHGSYIWSGSKESYLVSVKIGKTNYAKRRLYHPRRVKLCEPGDERDGVYPA
jgi:hypothetical protein